MFWGMVLNNNEFNGKGNKVLTKKLELNHNIYLKYIVCIVGIKTTSRFFAGFSHGP